MRIPFMFVTSLFMVIIYSSCQTLSKSQLKSINLYAAANTTAAQGIIETRKTLYSLQSDMTALNKATTWDQEEKMSDHLNDFINISVENDSLFIVYKEAFELLQKYSEQILAILNEEYGKELSDKTEKMGEHTDTLISSFNTVAKSEFKIGLGYWVKQFFDLGARKILKKKRYSIMKQGIQMGYNPMDSIYKFYKNIGHLNDSTSSHDLLTAIPREFNHVITDLMSDSSDVPGALTIYNDLQPLYQKLQVKNRKLVSHIKNTKELIEAIEPVYKALKDSFEGSSKDAASKEQLSLLKAALRKYTISYQNLNL